MFVSFSFLLFQGDMHGTDDHFLGFAINLPTFRNPSVFLISLCLSCSISVIIVMSVFTLVTIQQIVFTSQMNSILVVMLIIVIMRNVKISMYSIHNFLIFRLIVLHQFAFLMIVQQIVLKLILMRKIKEVILAVLMKLLSSLLIGGRLFMQV